MALSFADDDEGASICEPFTIRNRLECVDRPLLSVCLLNVADKMNIVASVKNLKL